jgi:riboflavin biosynthesis pyrimidine reductase
MILGPSTGEIGDDEVVDAYPWPASGRWVRAMMVTTLDGAAAGPDGLSGSISSAVDRAVFDAVRRLADAVLIGAGTMRAERYGPMRAQEADAGRRTHEGQAPAPVLAIVSGSLDLPWDEAVFMESAVAPIVLTGPESDPDRLATAREHADVVVLPDLAASTLVSTLTDRGLDRIVCEGGPTLLQALVRADLLDEADITVSPVFAGTDRTPRTNGLETTARLRLAHVITADSFLMVRYVRPDAS